VTAIGLAYAGQELASVPTGPFDQRLDGVLTETGWRPAEKE
jgi:5-formyltetrahydrofolate cyclo-ligase